MIAHKLLRDICAVSCVLTVSLDTGEKRYAHTRTGVFSGVNTETAAERERSSGQTQNPHVEHVIGVY